MGKAFSVLGALSMRLALILAWKIYYAHVDSTARARQLYSGITSLSVREHSKKYLPPTFIFHCIELGLLTREPLPKSPPRRCKVGSCQP